MFDIQGYWYSMAHPLPYRNAIMCHEMGVIIVRRCRDLIATPPIRFHPNTQAIRRSFEGLVNVVVLAILVTFVEATEKSGLECYNAKRCVIVHYDTSCSTRDIFIAI